MAHKCNNCGSTVSRGFHRVFSDNRGNLWSCNDCGDRQRVDVDLLKKHAE